MKGQHRMRQRGDSRYWDCVNAGCGQFLFDMKQPARRRIMPAVATAALGKCRGSWARSARPQTTKGEP